MILKYLIQWLLKYSQSLASILFHSKTVFSPAPPQNKIHPLAIIHSALSSIPYQPLICFCLYGFVYSVNVTPMDLYNMRSFVSGFFPFTAMSSGLLCVVVYTRRPSVVCSDILQGMQICAWQICASSVRPFLWKCPSGLA